MDWPDMEAKTRAALARAKNVTSHVAWLDVMSDIPSGALPCALDEIERLRGVLAERDRTIQAMTEASQSVIDRAAAVQQRFSSTVLAVPTWPLVSHIIPADIPRPTEAPSNPIDAAHPIKPENPDQNLQFSEGQYSPPTVQWADDPNVGRYFRPGSKRIEFQANFVVNPGPNDTCPPGVD